MAYQTGTSTGPADLLDKLRSFLIANGWAVNLWADDNTTYASWAGIDGTDKRLHVQKTATDSTVMYFNLRSIIRGFPFGDSYNNTPQYAGKYKHEVTGLCLNGSTGYDGGMAWDLQPGSTRRTDNGLSNGVCITELSVTAIPAYHFFQDGDTVIVCIEYQSGKYQWLIFGCLEKIGTYTGGQFFSGSLGSFDPSYQLLAAGQHQTVFLAANALAYIYYGNGAVYLNVDSVAAWRTSGYNGSESPGQPYHHSVCFSGMEPNANKADVVGRAHSNTLTGFFDTRSPNHYNSLAPFIPVYTLCWRASTNWSMVGWPKSIRTINIQDYDPADEIVLGTDTWMIFPSHSKADVDPVIGFAVKKVT